MSWRVERVVGRAAALHAASAATLDGDGPPGRLMRVLEADRPAVVLGAGQPDGHVDRGRAARLGLDVARRRSGGGAVLVGPGECIWVDLVIPRSDPLWFDDVGVAMRWVGEAWAAALGRGQVWSGPLVATPWSARVCFAGIGPGEVLDVDGSQRAKIVGISQRRTRAGALFQTAALLRWRPMDLLDALAVDPVERSAGAALLAGVAEPLTAADPGGVVAALEGALP